MNLFKTFLKEQDGQDGVEYALLIGFVSALIVAGATTFITGFSTFWSQAGTGVNKAGSSVASLP